MTVRAIVGYPDARLRVPAEPVVDFDEELGALVNDLVDTMRAAPGIGITAPHIGCARRVVVIELAAADGVRVYVNPEIVQASREMIRHEEGSISMPGVTEEVERHAKLSVRYRDQDGSERSEDTEGLLAVCLQHEIDQLDGMFWIHRLSRLKRERLIKRYEKLARR
ncbi:peptide deformylase [Bosea sp. LjRoot9]|uniref:peptide deformylase n=1 Tax=Bosea sp. LjRoot9 TaxID=3342341 RepID=UPI003ECE68F3